MWERREERKRRGLRSGGGGVVVVWCGVVCGVGVVWCGGGGVVWCGGVFACCATNFCQGCVQSPYSFCSFIPAKHGRRRIGTSRRWLTTVACARLVFLAMMHLIHETMPVLLMTMHLALCLQVPSVRRKKLASHIRQRRLHDSGRLLRSCERVQNCTKAASRGTDPRYQREENKNPTGAGKRLSIWTIIGLRVENQRSPVPQGAAGRGFSEKSGRQGKVREEAEQRDVSDHRACLYR